MLIPGTVCSLFCAMSSGQYTFFSVCSVQCVVCSVQCAVCSVRCEVCSVQCAVCSVQRIVYSEQCAVCNVNSTLHLLHVGQLLEGLVLGPIGHDGGVLAGASQQLLVPAGTIRGESPTLWANYDGHPMSRFKTTQPKRALPTHHTNPNFCKKHLL